MTTVATLLTDIAYDLKLSTADQTTRQAELISYMNRVIRNGLSPELLRFESDYGMKAWTSKVTSTNVRTYAIPSDLMSFHVLYCIQADLTGYLVTGGTATLVLATSASTTNDEYNGKLIRIASGTGADQQSAVYDYVGSTYMVYLSPALSTCALGDGYLIFPYPDYSNELTQVSVDELADYGSPTTTPEVYALERNTYVTLGGIPNSDDVVLFGYYYYKPAALTATTDNLPYDSIFDEPIRAGVVRLALNRDEYNVSVEHAILQELKSEVAYVLRSRNRRRAQSKIVGSRDS